MKPTLFDYFLDTQIIISTTSNLAQLPFFSDVPHIVLYQLALFHQSLIAFVVQKHKIPFFHFFFMFSSFFLQQTLNSTTKNCTQQKIYWTITHLSLLSFSAARMKFCCAFVVFHTYCVCVFKPPLQVVGSLCLHILNIQDMLLMYDDAFMLNKRDYKANFDFE